MMFTGELMCMFYYLVQPRLGGASSSGAIGGGASAGANGRPNEERPAPNAMKVFFCCQGPVLLIYIIGFLSHLNV